MNSTNVIYVTDWVPVFYRLTGKW